MWANGLIRRLMRFHVGQVIDSRIAAAEASQRIDDLVQIAMAIKAGWKECLSRPGTWGYSPHKNLSPDAIRISHIKALLRNLPPQDVCRALLRNLRINHSLVVTHFSGLEIHERSPFKPHSKIVISFLERIRLAEPADLLLTEEEAIEQLLLVGRSSRISLSLTSLLSDATGYSYSKFSRRSLYQEEPGSFAAWIHRVSRDLYSYGVCYLDW
jgi:hypothetical protein